MGGGEGGRLTLVKGKRWVFNFDLKEERDGAWRIEGGNSFQDEGPATEKARDSIVFRRSGRGIVREEGSVEERSERDGMWRLRRSERYEGARL